jgi:L-seryl-tRNA(Ser) seleniumtransferase
MRAGAERTANDVYHALGVKPVINAAGTMTALGGSIMPADVRDAWNAASRSFVPLVELQDRVGERIASLLGVEAALVTTGAAGGILLGTAAALTYRDHSLVARLPLPPDRGMEVIRQKSHHECYDNLVVACGVRLVDVETTEELQRAINPRTAMMFSYNVHEDAGRIKRDEWVAVARRQNIPTLLDAAADVPPSDALWKYNHMGFDMVVFSGGKALRGPQSAGLLLGRKDLIEAAKLNTAPRCGNMGRGMKVSKEEMVAMHAAVARFLRLDHAAEWREWERRIAVIVHALKDVPGVATKQIVPPIANHFPHLLISWDERRLGVTRDQLKQQLADGDPPIMTARVHGTGDEGFLVSVFTLEAGEEQIVAERIRRVLARA